MAKDPQNLRDLNVKTEEAFEQSMKQASKQTQGAMDTYFSLIQQTMSATPWGHTEFGEKLKNFTEQNIAAAQEHVQKLSQAKSFQDVVRIQTEFMQTQLSLFADQAKNLGEAYMKAAAGAIKVPTIS
jgi:hypothetical protein